MTEKELSQYRKLLKEAEDLQGRIAKLHDKEITTSHGTVKGSSKNFPYIEYHYGVWIDDPTEVDTRDKLIKVYTDRVDRARKEILRIEQFINSIPDSELRQIFEYRFVDGLKQWKIAEMMNMDRSSIGKKIYKYLNFPPIPQKSII